MRQFSSTLFLTDLLYKRVTVWKTRDLGDIYGTARRGGDDYAEAIGACTVVRKVNLVSTTCMVPAQSDWSIEKQNIPHCINSFSGVA